MQHPAPISPHAYRGPLTAQNATDWRNRAPFYGPGQNQAQDHGQVQNQTRQSFQRGGWNPGAGNKQYHMNEYHAGMSGDGEYVRESMKATDEGRRLYFGNLDYDVIPEDIALWLEGAGFEIKVIDIPARDDNFRKPVFCFVEFYTREVADQVLRTCNLRTMRGRQIRIDHSRRGNRQHTGNAMENAPFKPFNALTESEVDISKLTINDDNGTVTQQHHMNRMPRILPTARLFVGGLPHLENTNELDDLIMELFRGFNVESVSSIHQSKDPKFKDLQNTSFCFVDVPNINDAKMAIEILNNRETSWGTARVNFATGGIVPPRNRPRGEGPRGPGGNEGFQPLPQQQQVQEGGETKEHPVEKVGDSH